MGLDTTHGCWHGAYSAFSRWRTHIAKLAGMPPLMLMEGFYNPGCLNPYSGRQYTAEEVDSLLPIRWEALKEDPLHDLLNHSDCEGEIPWEKCAGIADRLEDLLPLLPTEVDGGHIGDWTETTKRFIDGLRLAHGLKENVDFH